MQLPEPKPGLVINYRFLWDDMKQAGLEDPRYARPCMVLREEFSTPRKSVFS